MLVVEKGAIHIYIYTSLCLAFTYVTAVRVKLWKSGAYVNVIKLRRLVIL